MNKKEKVKIEKALTRQSKLNIVSVINRNTDIETQKKFLNKNKR